MPVKSGAKSKGRLTRGLKNDIKNLVNFHASSWKSQNLLFDGLFLLKAYKVLDEKVLKSYLSWHWRVMQSLKKTDSWFQKWHKKFLNFNASSDKSDNMHFYVLLLSKEYKVSAKKVQKSYISWHWRVIRTLKKNWRFFEKWYEEFGEF